LFQWFTVPKTQLFPCIVWKITIWVRSSILSCWISADYSRDMYDDDYYVDVHVFEFFHGWGLIWGVFGSVFTVVLLCTSFQKLYYICLRQTHGLLSRSFKWWILLLLLVVRCNHWIKPKIQIHLTWLFTGMWCYTSFQKLLIKTFAFFT